MWIGFETMCRAYIHSENKDMWTDPLVALFKKNNIRPGTWVIIDNKKFTYEPNQKRDGYIIHIKDHSDA